MSTARQHSETAPVDLELMRETASLLVTPDALAVELPPAARELDAVTARLRGHLELLVREVEAAACDLPDSSIRKYCALACAGEARGKLRTEPTPRYGGELGHARRLARVLNTLCDHYEELGAR
ncbi:DUF6415 family natural product biosynthesis protein [Streptomyces sp. NPDC006134]|uniref:DUF6415 family natural product biosynthesis protein n=1 Tax=Streptomyces sp. NPDC006134 TaxID=3154467 RepID=UPI0033EAFF59